jgi:hypothetical protein
MLHVTRASTRGLRSVCLRSAAWYAGFAVYAGCVALFSGPGLDHWWGAWATGGYAVAAVVATWRPTRHGHYAALTAAVLGALVAPLIWLAVHEPITSDSFVVARSGVQLLHHGIPYLPVARLAAGGWLAYNPYLPVMAVFGLPKALGLPGLLGDPRPWLAAATFLLLLATFRVTNASHAAARDGTGRRNGMAPRNGAARRGEAGRPVVGSSTLPATAPGLAAFLLASPIMAFPLAMGITDPPIIAMMCLALALVIRSRHLLAAAAVIGAAAAMKYTAWPALAIIAVTVAGRDGVRAAVRFTGAAVISAVVLSVAFAPAAFANLPAVLQNTVAYPLGLTVARSPAQSPLPGHLLSELGKAGHLTALGLLALACLAIAVSLVVAPPVTSQQAAIRIALGLAALFTFGPATRFGYFVYPLGLCGWAALTSRRLTGLSLVAAPKRQRGTIESREGPAARFGAASARLSHAAADSVQSETSVNV